MDHKASFRAPIIALLLGLGGAAHAADTQPIPTSITAVTVYADRAQVTRSGGVDLPAAGGRFAVMKLPGWIDAESVRATLVPPSAGKILDVTVETAFLAEASEEAVRKAEAAVREVQDQIGTLADEEKVLADEVARLESLRTFTIDKLPKEMATRDINVKNLGATLAFVTEALRTDRKALRELGKKKRELEPTLAARTRERNEIQTRAQLQQSTVVLELKGSGHASLVLSYLTPGATWEPTGELRVSKGGQSVTLTQYASVVQTTGEDWDKAALSFSTQRPGELLGVPEAQALLLGQGGAGMGDVLNRMGESFNKAQANYSQQNEFFAKGKDKWRQSLANQMEIQTRSVENFARLAQRGTTAHFTALTERLVRADGKAVRVPISTSDFAATLHLVAVPEVSLNAVRTAELTNSGAQAILPGKIALFEDGAFVGTSEVGFVAPGESFSTFLGVNDRLKLERVIDRKASSLERGSRRTELTVAFILSAENLGDQPVTLEVSDHVPVSQDEDIEVSEVDVPKGAKADANGVLKWSPVIPAHTKVTWRVSYTLEYPNDHAQRARASRNNQKKANEPASPAPSRSLYDDIENLEKSF